MGPVGKAAPSVNGPSIKVFQPKKAKKNCFDKNCLDCGNNEDGDSPQKCYKDNRILFALAVRFICLFSSPQTNKKIGRKTKIFLKHTRQSQCAILYALTY